jgi:hypothetical protein
MVGFIKPIRNSKLSTHSDPKNPRTKWNQDSKTLMQRPLSLIRKAEVVTWFGKRNSKSNCIRIFTLIKIEGNQPL